MTASPDFTTSYETATGRRVRRDDLLDRAQPWMVLAFRCVVAVLFVLHPLDSLGLLGGPAPEGALSAIFVVEIVLIALVVLGFLARTAAFLLSGMMAFAYFSVHLPDGWNWLENGGEPAALYSWIFLLLVVLGPGPLSLRRSRNTG